MKIVCLGDSLTAGYGVRRSLNWVSLLNAGSTHEWVNAGVSGDTTGGMLARLQNDVFAQKPDAALLIGGINDILLTESFEAAKANLSAMVNQCAARRIRPIVGIPYPLNPDVPQPWEPLINFRRAAEIQSAYADWLRLFTQTFRLRFVDFDKTWRNDFSFAGRAQLYLSDGLHPSPAGHRRIADEILRQTFPRSARSMASKNLADSDRT